jgi:hypothetical protein
MVCGEHRIFRSKRKFRTRIAKHSTLLSCTILSVHYKESVSLLLTGGEFSVFQPTISVRVQAKLIALARHAVFLLELASRSSSQGASDFICRNYRKCGVVASHRGWSHNCNAEHADVIRTSSYSNSSHKCIALLASILLFFLDCFKVNQILLCIII